MSKQFDITNLLEKMKLAAECGFRYELVIEPAQHKIDNAFYFHFNRLPDRTGFFEEITSDNHFSLMSQAMKMIQEDAEKTFNHLESQREEASIELARIKLAKKAADELISKPG